MKKKFKYIIGFCFIILIIIILGLFVITNQKKVKNSEPTSQKEEDVVEKQLNSLSLEEKIAQMLIVYYNSNVADQNLINILQKNKPGGFILFKDNFSSYEGTLSFINDIKKTADIPMFISIDQEGGIVDRLSSLADVKVTKVPSMLKVGKTKDINLAHDIGKVIAEELRTLGINMDFAPVIDVIEDEKSSYIGNRSFGTDVDNVTGMGVALADGLRENGIIPVFKHFPGHGSTIDDSHYFLPVIKKTKEELLAKDLIPFQKAIDSGAEIIMIGHLAVPEITGDETPASLSKVLINDLLKDELGYKGLVVTDALNMGALIKNYGEQEIYEMAINAGVDLLLMPKSSSSAITLIKDSIAKGKIKEEQIDNSVRKILTLKSEKLQKDNNLDKDFLGSSAHQKIIDKIED